MKARLDTPKGIVQTSRIDSGDPPLPVKASQYSILNYNCTPPPPSFATIAAQPPSLNTLKLTPTNLTFAAAALELTIAVKKHQADSLSLLHVATGTGTILDSKMGLLRKRNVSLMLPASIHIQKAGGTRLLLETLYEITHLKVRGHVVCLPRKTL
jgi:hypothetical protein